MGSEPFHFQRSAADEEINAALILVCSVCSYEQWVTLDLTLEWEVKRRLDWPACQNTQRSTLKPLVESIENKHEDEGEFCLCLAPLSVNIEITETW